MFDYSPQNIIFLILFIVYFILIVCSIIYIYTKIDLQKSINKFHMLLLWIIGMGLLFVVYNIFVMYFFSYDNKHAELIGTLNRIEQKIPAVSPEKKEVEQFVIDSKFISPMNELKIEISKLREAILQKLTVKAEAGVSKAKLWGLGGLFLFSFAALIIGLYYLYYKKKPGGLIASILGALGLTLTIGLTLTMKLDMSFKIGISESDVMKELKKTVENVNDILDKRLDEKQTLKNRHEDIIKALKDIEKKMHPGEAKQSSNQSEFYLESLDSVGPFETAQCEIKGHEPSNDHEQKKCESLEKVYAKIREKIHGHKNKLIFMLLVGSADRRPLKGKCRENYGSNAELARRRAAWIRDCLTDKQEFKETIDPSRFIILTRSPQYFGLDVPQERLAEDRKVEVYALWSKPLAKDENTSER